MIERPEPRDGRECEPEDVPEQCPGHFEAERNERDDEDEAAQALDRLIHGAPLRFVERLKGDPQHHRQRGERHVTDAEQ